MCSNEEAAVIEAAKAWRHYDPDRTPIGLTQALDALERSQAPKSLREAINATRLSDGHRLRDEYTPAFCLAITEAAEAFINSKRDEISAEVPVASLASTYATADAIIALLVGDEG